MTLGPIDIIALEFPGNRFKGEILPELFDLVDKGIIRIIDVKMQEAIKRMDAGLSAADVGRELGVNQYTLYRWKKKYGGLEVSDARRLRQVFAAFLALTSLRMFYGML